MAVDSYELSERDIQKIFIGRIVPAELSDAEPRKEPVAVFLMGQQGAGKTKVADSIAAGLGEAGGFVDLDSDVYKAHHPDYDRIMTRGDRMMAAHLGPAGQWWMRMAQEYARENRLNTLVQTTAQNPEFLAETLKEFRRAGYQISVPIMAVPEAMSQQGILNRYHEQSQERGSGRLTVPEKARLSYVGILVAAEVIDSGRLADTVAVYRRGNAEPVYTNQIGPDGDWAEPPRLREPVEAERSRPWTAQESLDFRRVQGKLTARMGAEWRERLVEIENLARPFIVPRYGQ